MHPSEPGDGHIIPSHENMVLGSAPPWQMEYRSWVHPLFVPGIQLFGPLRRQNGLLVKGLKAGNDAELKLVFFCCFPLDKGPGLLKLPLLCFSMAIKRGGDTMDFMFHSSLGSTFLKSLWSTAIWRTAERISPVSFRSHSRSENQSFTTYLIPSEAVDKKALPLYSLTYWIHPEASGSGHGPQHQFLKLQALYAASVFPSEASAPICLKDPGSAALPHGLHV